MPDYRLEIVSRPPSLARAAETLAGRAALALDIETVEWWNRRREKIALVQLAFRERDGGVKVIVVDALAGFDLTPLRAPLEAAATVKAIHNAAFDAVKLFDHFEIATGPIHDTMIAARQSGEKRYSLQSQAAAHLNLFLDKSAQRGDWSRRPLDFRQLDYAARDAYATLLLYENQLSRNLAGGYVLKNRPGADQRPLFPPGAPDEPVRPAPPAKRPAPSAPAASAAAALTAPARALLGVIKELPGRYGPDQLAVSAGAGRVGLAGWIIDRALGRETDLDEDAARLAIGELFDRGLAALSELRRLEITAKGRALLAEEGTP